MELKPKDIDDLHKELTQAIFGCLQHTVTIGPSSEIADDWKKVRRGQVQFLFRFIDQHPIERFAPRNKAGDCPVVPLPVQVDGGPTAWASWHELWCPTDAKSFRLCQASWTFFWATDPERNARQLFRAEWDNPGARDAPQPHWNIDATRAGTGRAPEQDAAVPPISAVRETGLYEPPYPQELPAAKFPDLHFAMGGWTHSPCPPFPQCIQCGLEQQLFVRWASTTLEHVSTELRRLADAG